MEPPPPVQEQPLQSSVEGAAGVPPPVDESAPPPPTHILMMQSAEAEAVPPQLPHALERDYLGQRYHLQQQHPTKKPLPDPFWNGATPLERSFLMTLDDDGVLSHDDATTFVGLMTTDHAVSSMALALAIVERTADCDARDRMEYEATSRELGLLPPLLKQKRRTEDDESYSDDDDDDIMDDDDDDESMMEDDDENEKDDESMGEAQEKTPPPSSTTTRGARKSQQPPPPVMMTQESETSSSHQDLTLDSSKSEEEADEQHEIKEVPTELVTTGPVVPARPKDPPVRLQAFIRAGGLQVLSRWLLEASRKNNSMEPLLLPLLVVLAKLPFDLQAIKESRLNKRLKALSKELATATQSTPLRVKTQAALDKLMNKWEELAHHQQQQNEENEKKETVEDPFAELHAQLNSRLQDLQAYRSNTTTPPETPLPPWLAKLQASIKPSPPKKPPGRSIEELAKQERAMEARALHNTDLQEDLKQTQRARREFLQKLETMKTASTTTRTKKKATKITTTTRGVTWKDGHGRASRVKQKELLEAVRMFRKEDIPCVVNNPIVYIDGDDDEQKPSPQQTRCWSPELFPEP